MAKTLALIVLLAAYLLARSGMSRLLRQVARRKAVLKRRADTVERVLQVSLFLVFALVASLIVGRDQAQLPIVLSSLVALFGVALFAYWSMLSNITASLIIYFGFPYRAGDRIKVIETEGLHLEGELEEIGLFHVRIRQDGGSIVTYPNTLILQRAVIKLDGAGEKREETGA